MGASVGTEPRVTANECGAKFTRAFDNSLPQPRVTQLAGRPAPGRRSCNQRCCLCGQSKQSPGRSLGWAAAEAGPWSCRAPPSGAPATLLPAPSPPTLVRPGLLPDLLRRPSFTGRSSPWQIRCSQSPRPGIQMALLSPDLSGPDLGWKARLLTGCGQLGGRDTPDPSHHLSGQLGTYCQLCMLQAV